MNKLSFNQHVSCKITHHLPNYKMRAHNYLLTIISDFIFVPRNMKLIGASANSSVKRRYGHIFMMYLYSPQIMYIPILYTL